MVLQKLEHDGLVVRSVGARDRRRHSLQLTRSGEKLLSQLAAPAQKAKARALAAFTPREQMLFLQLLDKFTRAFNCSTRVPLDPHRSTEKEPLGMRQPDAARTRKVRERRASSLARRMG
jgi:hypothetical protein